MPTSTPPTHSLPVSPLFQIILIIISIICIAIGIQYGLSRLVISDETPQLIPITPTTIKEFGGFPEIVTTGLYIHEFQTFDMIANSFVFTGVVWFMLSPGVVSLDLLSKFEFERGVIQYLGPPRVILLDKKLLVQFPVRAQITSNLNYAAFPIDDHRLYFILNNHLIFPDIILFFSSQQDFSVRPDMRTFGWEQMSTSVKFGYGQEITDQYDERKTLYYPSVIFAIDYARYGTRYIISILLPLLLIFYLTLFSLSFRTTADRTGITLAAGGITAILAYRFVIGNLSPTTGYFTISDYLFFLFLTASAVTFFLAIIDHFALSIPVAYKKLAIIFLHMIVIGVTVYLFVL